MDCCGSDRRGILDGGQGRTDHLLDERFIEAKAFPRDLEAASSSHLDPKKTLVDRQAPLELLIGDRLPISRTAKPTWLAAASSRGESLRVACHLDS